MITDALIRLVSGLFDGIAALLPDGNLTLPNLSGVRGWLADINSVLPIGGVVQVAVYVLGLAVIFITVRMLMMGWKALPFT